jgi:hypothetical protein
LRALSLDATQDPDGHEFSFAQPLLSVGASFDPRSVPSIAQSFEAPPEMIRYLGISSRRIRIISSRAFLNERFIFTAQCCYVAIDRKASVQLACEIERGVAAPKRQSRCFTTR